MISFHYVVLIVVSEWGTAPSYTRLYVKKREETFPAKTKRVKSDRGCFTKTVLWTS